MNHLKVDKVENRRKHTTGAVFYSGGGTMQPTPRTFVLTDANIFNLQNFTNTARKLT